MFIPTLSLPCSLWCGLLLVSYGSCQWPCPRAVACSIVNIVRAFWKAWSRWGTEWVPLSLITVHLLKSSDAGLPLTPFSHRFFIHITPMQAVEMIFRGTGLSRKRLLPNDCFYFVFHTVPSILVCFVWTILHICLSAVHLKKGNSLFSLPGSRLARTQQKISDI